ncbi:hypothetical protein [Arthrobacter sp. 35W]|uniref:hypothetical protein n=1 Tax=Arthrobacter sp. 35W TaxID=1132441 RepID=UPI00040C551D|nr:hypothetical protein [Arthrobacter sp. 35W]
MSENNSPTPPQFQQPQPVAYPTAPNGAYQGAPAQDPGKVMGIISIILPFVGLGLVGLILGLIGMSKSKKAGFKNTPALVGVILGALAIVITIVVAIIGISAATQLATDIQQQCSNGSPTFTVNGQTGSCTGI